MLIGVLIVVAAVAGYSAILSSRAPKEVVTVKTVTEKITRQGTVTTTQFLTTTASRSVDQIVYLLPFTPAGVYAPLWYGAQSGIFLEQGVQVTIASTTGSGDAISKLDLGLGQFANFDTATWIKAALSGSKSKAIGMFRGKNEALVIYNKNKINTPKDLEGKNVGSTSGNLAEAQFPIFAEKVGIDPSKVKIITTTPAALYSLMGEGQFDAIFTNLPGIATSKRIAQEKKFEIGVFAYHDYGIVSFGMLVHANENVIKSNPNLVRRFLAGFYRAFKHSIEKPQDGVKMLVDLNPGLNYENELDKMKDLISWNNPSTHFQTKPIGKIDDQFMKETVANVARMFKLQLSSEEYYKTLYTNEFLPETIP